jgi:hypothetical protein
MHDMMLSVAIKPVLLIVVILCVVSLSIVAGNPY